MTNESPTARLRRILAEKARKTASVEHKTDQPDGTSETKPSSVGISTAPVAASVPEADRSLSQGNNKQTVVKYSDSDSQEIRSVREKLLELETALEERRPNFQYLLRDIHQAMRKQADVVTALDEEEIGLVVRGLSTMKGIALGVEAKASSSSRSSGTRTRKTKVITADQI